MPEATTEKVTGSPSHTAWEAGGVEMEGSVSTVSVAGLLVALPTKFVTTQS